ncbi:hypothetical protein O3M35_000557 [Rhynocoris fuscipes]|uniref:Uncharacterized protein n=1 Tax=Rhynocoris fuscipes TaxID=488301 RepID=A0AAW1DPA4_9HEMI
MLDSESESDRSRIDNGERTKGERFQYNRFTPSDTSSTVYNMETTSSTLSERGKMPIPQRATLFFKSLPIDGEDASSEHDKIKGRPPKLLKEIPKSAFQYYQIRINEKPNKVRPDLLELRKIMR